VTRTLVAGIGNVFFGDDGFGCEVARRLAGAPPRDGVSVVDFGIRGMHLAYELSSGGWDAAIIVDAVARGGRVGTLYVLDPALDDDAASAPSVADAHGVDLGAVFAMTRTLGVPPARVVVVGCEAATVDEGMGLSVPLLAAVEPAVALVHQLLEGGRQ
jgi:hydrogenase maturation protease